MKQRGKHTARWFVGLGLVVIAIGVFVSYDRLIEFWHIHKLDSETDARVRVAAEKLGEIGSPRAIPALIKALDIARMPRGIRGYSEDMGFVELSAAGKLQRTLQEALEESLQKLTNRRGKAAVPYLIQGLQHDDWYLRQLSASLLGNLNQQARSALSTLRTAASRDRSQVVRWRASLALSRIEARVKISRQDHGPDG